MTTASPNQRRHWMRRQARERQRAEGCNYTTALFRVRRSEVLKFLDRHRGEDIPIVEIARATAVPVGAVKSVVGHLVKAGQAEVQKAQAERAEEDIVSSP